MSSCSFVHGAGRGISQSCRLETCLTSGSPIDPLGEALHFLRMSGVFYCRSEFTRAVGARAAADASPA